MHSNLVQSQTIVPARDYVESYSYNNNDDRIYKGISSAPTTATYYLRDAGGKELATLNISSNAWIYYAYGRERVAEFGNRAVSYYNYDHLGSVRVMYQTDNNCQTSSVNYTLLSANDYMAFGKTLRSFNVSKYTFTGKEKDRLTNLDYFGARNYDEDIARWTTNDPHKEKYPNYSPYAYAACNPVYFIDPDGKDIIVYDANGKAYTYSVGATGANGSKSVQETFSVLNELYQNTDADAKGGASPKAMMDEFMIHGSKHDWKITQFAQKNNGTKMGTTFFDRDITVKNFKETKTTYSKIPGENPDDAFTRINPFLIPFMLRDDDGKLYETSPVVTLAHELSHAFDQIFKYLQYSAEKKNGQGGVSHTRAIESQNNVARRKGETQRAESGDKKIMVTDTQ